VTVDSCRFRSYDSTVSLSDGYSCLQGWVNLKDVILRSVNHFKRLYDLLVMLEGSFHDPPLPLPALSSLFSNPGSIAGFALPAPVNPPLSDIAMKVLTSIEESATEIGLQRTTDRVRHFKKYLQSVGSALNLNDPRIEQEARTLREALDDDLDERKVFFPSNEKYAFVAGMGKKYNFTAIHQNLPDAHRELVQAQFCYVADNDTACAYHAMGAAEYGLQALAKRLRIPRHQQATWGQLIKNIRSKLEKMQGQVKTAKRNQELDFYSQLLDQCAFFNEHWRKQIAHLPPRYTAAEALNALTRSAEFLKLLSERGMKLARSLPVPTGG
jgi:hypothetical protein